MLAEVLFLIVSHLSVGDVFRLQRVTARDEVWKDKEVLAALRTRMGLRPVGNHSISALRRRMAKTAGRCRECAAKTQRSNRVCVRCSKDYGCPVAQITRAQMCMWLGTQVTRSVLKAVPPIHGFAPGRAYLYWFSDVKRFLKTH